MGLGTHQLSSGSLFFDAVMTSKVGAGKDPVMALVLTPARCSLPTCHGAV